MDDVTLAWVAGACVVAAASFVQGLAGFGIGLVALAFLPFLMSPDTAIVLMTVYTVVFSTAMFVPLRRSFVMDGMGGLDAPPRPPDARRAIGSMGGLDAPPKPPDARRAIDSMGGLDAPPKPPDARRAIDSMGGLDAPPKPPDARRATAKPWRSSITLLLMGSVIGTPPGVWLLATLPVGVLNRTIGAVLVTVVVLEWLGVYPERLHGRAWALGAGLTAGVIGAAVGTPGPPVVLYMASQGWAPRTIKANLQAFFVVNQAVILIGYWWAGLLTAEVGRFTVLFAVPAVLGIVAGMALFDRVDQVWFRKIVFALLFVSGLALLVRG